MKKSNPILDDDDFLYTCTPEEVGFVLSSRRAIDRNHGDRFNEELVRSLKASVGFYFHSAEDAFFRQEIVFPRLVGMLSKIGVYRMYAVPTGYLYSEKNSDSDELTKFLPPLIAKSPTSIDMFTAVRGSMIALYTRKYMIFSACLRYAVMDFNGYYSMIMGPRSVVQEALGMSVEDSWHEVRLGISFEPELLDKLRKTMNVYGY